jgi:anaerobic ribonucleoside-triphosphate reductase activating protein
LDSTLGTTVAVDDLIEQMLKAPVEGITLLGGEPFDQAEGMAAVGHAAQQAGLGVMTFTGYRHEVLRRRCRPGWADLLAATDLLVDGPYLRDRLDLTRPWVGSSNQRFIHLTDRYRSLSFDSERDRIEVRIRRDGAVAINGWPDDQLISALEELLGDEL